MLASCASCELPQARNVLRVHAGKTTSPSMGHEIVFFRHVLPPADELTLESGRDRACSKSGHQLQCAEMDKDSSSEFCTVGLLLLFWLVPAGSKAHHISGQSRLVSSWTLCVRLRLFAEVSVWQRSRRRCRFCTAASRVSQLGPAGLESSFDL